jgi:DNA-binding transcriptional LysR family regulator
MWGPPVFDPSTAQRMFRVAMTDAVSLAVLPPLLKRLQDAAPGVSLAITNCGMQDGTERILAGELELGVGVFLDIPTGLRAKVVAENGSLMCVASRDNTRLKDGALDLGAYLAVPHVVVGINRDPGVTIDMAVAALGLMRRVAAIVPHFTSVPAIVRGTDIVGPSTPEIVAGLSYRDELVLFPPPLPAQSYALSLVWRSSATRDVALAWLRGFIEETVRAEVDWQGAGAAAAMNLRTARAS